MCVEMGGAVTARSPAIACATTTDSKLESTWDSKLLFGRLLADGQHEVWELLPDAVDPESSGMEPGGDPGSVGTVATFVQGPFVAPLGTTPQHPD